MVKLNTATAMIIVLVIIASCFISTPTQAQDIPSGITAGTIIDQAKGILDGLGNIGAQLGGNFSISANQTASQISALLAQFSAAVGTNITAPLNSFGMDVQALGRKLIFITTQLDSVLTHQRNCGVTNGEMLISALQNVSLHLGNSIPFGDSGTPSLYSFQFTGHDPEVVPPQGGAIVFKGYKLWTDHGAPDIQLADDFGNKSALPASRGGSDDEFSSNIEPSGIIKNAGKTLQFVVTTHARKHFWFIPYGDDPHTLQLGFAIPQAFQLKYKIEGHVAYYCSANKSAELAEQDFNLVNNSCEHDANVSDMKTWALPSGSHIRNAAFSGFRYASSIDKRNNLNINVSYTSNTVTAAGWLDTASCVCAPFVGCHLDHNTHWIVGVVPTVSYTEDVEHDGQLQSLEVAAQLPITTANFQIPTACNEQGVHTLAYTVSPVINGEVRPALESAVVSGNEKAVDDQKIHGPLTVEASWNPNTISGFSNLGVRVTQNTCGY